VPQASLNVTVSPTSLALDKLGIRNIGTLYRNLSVPILYEHAIRRGEGELGVGGSFVARTGIHTGRSPKDKYIVEEPSTKSDVWWGDTNRPADAALFDSMHKRIITYFQCKDLYVQD